MRTSRVLSVPETDRKELERLARARSAPQKVVLRAKIVLLSDDGVPTGQIAERLQTTVPTISRWRDRYEGAGVQGLLRDGPRPGRTFKPPRDPQFIEKLQAVVGLYVDPPKKAIVFSVDEKSQIQALDRTQPGLPMKRGRAGTM